MAVNYLRMVEPPGRQSQWEQVIPGLLPGNQMKCQMANTHCKCAEMDQAGNVGDPASITLIVDNGPPAVSITERWWIWETGELKVSPNHFPIASVQVTIRDPQNRWPAVVMSFDPDKGTDSISWNRHFADGTLAPSGEYPVVAVACDVHGLCGRDTGMHCDPNDGDFDRHPDSIANCDNNTDAFRHIHSNTNIADTNASIGNPLT